MRWGPARRMVQSRRHGLRFRRTMGHRGQAHRRVACRGRCSVAIPARAGPLCPAERRAKARPAAHRARPGERDPAHADPVQAALGALGVALSRGFLAVAPQPRRSGRRGEVLPRADLRAARAKAGRDALRRHGRPDERRGDRGRGARGRPAGEADDRVPERHPRGDARVLPRRDGRAPRGRWLGARGAAGRPASASPRPGVARAAACASASARPPGSADRGARGRTPGAPEDGVGARREGGVSRGRRDRRAGARPKASRALCSSACARG